MVDELEYGSKVIGRYELKLDERTYQTLLFDTPSGERVAVYLDKLANRFRVIRLNPGESL